MDFRWNHKNSEIDENNPNFRKFMKDDSSNSMFEDLESEEEKGNFKNKSLGHHFSKKNNEKN